MSRIRDEYMGEGKPVIATKDNVSADLLEMIEDAELEVYSMGFEDPLDVEAKFKDLLMQKLCSYIVRRDHKVHNHAFHLGKESNAKTDSKNTHKDSTAADTGGSDK